MTKIIPGSCESQVVKYQGQTVEALILSQGNKASTGLILIDQDLLRYLTSNASDIRDLILKLVSIVQKLETISTGLDAASNSPGGQTVNIAQLATLRGELDAMKDNLK